MVGKSTDCFKFYAEDYTESTLMLVTSVRWLSRTLQIERCDVVSFIFFIALQSSSAHQKDYKLGSNLIKPISRHLCGHTDSTGIS